MERSKTIRVKGGPNGPVFREGERRQLDADGKDTTVIVEKTVVEVPNTRYYRQRIAKGDLVLVEEEAT